MTTALAPIEDKRNAALLKAVGLDRVPPEQRELALAIADRYELDLMLKHLVLIEGRPYLTRDGLLHIAHRSGVFDGMEVSDPVIVDIGAGKYWSARCSVYRKDMSRPFTYAGRYPLSGGNAKFAPEMAVKVSEVMALRRAFDVSAPVIEERWDLPAVPDPEPPRSTSDAIAARRANFVGAAQEAISKVQAVADSHPTARITSGPTDVPSGVASVAPVATVVEPAAAPVAAAGETAPTEVPVGKCTAFHAELGRCTRPEGHPDGGKSPLFHVASEGQTWKDA